MAALKKNGTELMRLQRFDDQGLGNAKLEVQISVRSNGWLLKGSRWIGHGFRDNLSWKQWIRFKPFDEKTTTTMPQQVDHLIRNRGFEVKGGSMDQVVAGWQKLVEGDR